MTDRPAEAGDESCIAKRRVRRSWLAGMPPLVLLPAQAAAMGLRDGEHWGDRLVVVSDV